MKFEGQRLSRNGETVVYDFIIGAKELRLMFDFLRNDLKNLPKGVLEIEQTRQRLKEIVKTLELQVRANKIK